jgi:hypothetical protein
VSSFPTRMNDDDLVVYCKSNSGMLDCPRHMAFIGVLRHVLD